jgi:hypothetical protein
MGIPRVRLPECSDDRAKVEIKAVSALTGEHQSQVINYLKGTDKEIGILVNFGRSKIEYKRLYNPVIKHINPSWLSC